MRPLPALRRLFLLGTAVVCLVGQASAFAHLALVRHASCPEHEDALVHTSAIGSDSNSAVLPDALDGRRITAPPPGAGDGHEDDHCLMAAFRRGSLTAPDAGAGELLAASDGPLAPPPQTRSSRPGPVPLLLLAPKSSPPAAG